MKKIFGRLISSSALIAAILAGSSIVAPLTSHAATGQSIQGNTVLHPLCAASVNFSPGSQTVSRGQQAAVLAAVTCPDWVWGTDVSFYWGDGSARVVQNTKDYTTFYRSWGYASTFVTDGHVNGLYGNSTTIHAN